MEHAVVHVNFDYENLDLSARQELKYAGMKFVDKFFDFHPCP